MRISMIGPFGLRQKGTSRARVLPMAWALAGQGHQVKVLLPPWDSPEDSGTESEMDGVCISHVSLPPSFPGLFHVVVAHRLATKALAFRPDIVHCFKPKAHAGMAAFLLWYMGRIGLTKVKLVLDADDWEGPGGWNEIGRYSKIQRSFFAFQERWGLSHCHALTVASRALETIAWSRGIPKRKVFYIPNGWPDSTIPPGNKVPERSKTKTVLLLTRFVEFDSRWLVDVWKGVIRAMPSAELLVVGKGFLGEERAFLQSVKEEGLSDTVRYLGWLGPEELHRSLQEVRLAIFPYADTLVNRTKCSARLVELMAHGLPVVATDVGENREYLEHRSSGWLVPPGDTCNLIEGVVYLLSNKEMSTALGQGAQERIRIRFRWQDLVKGVEEAYQSAVGQRQSCPEGSTHVSTQRNEC